MRKTLQWEGLGGLYKVLDLILYNAFDLSCCGLLMLDCIEGFSSIKKTFLCAGRDLSTCWSDVFQSLHVLSFWGSQAVLCDESRRHNPTAHHGRFL